MAGTPFERGEVHRHHYVWALTGNHRTLREVEPLPADLTERVGSALAGRARIELGTPIALFAGSVSLS